jgi:hypothetical protein
MDAINSNPDIERIWKQGRTPVVYRQGNNAALLVRVPFARDNRQWLQGTRRNKPHWDKESLAWIVAKSWLDDVINVCLGRHGRVYVIQPYRVQEKCAPACWNAKGYECQCSCMGKNHGSEHPSGRWRIVSDTFAVQWHGEELACRLVTANGPSEVFA